MSETMTLACNSGWLGDTVQMTTSCESSWVSDWPSVYYAVYSSPARPIKLTLTEIETLRKTAKADPKVKAILFKFTEQIEIAVDFG